MKIQENKNFRNWFRKSKTIDKEKNPIVFYHGTNADFHSFSHKHIGSENFVDKEGFFFTGQPEMATYFAAPDDQGYSEEDQWNGAVIVPVYLKMENPLKLKEVLKIIGWKRSNIDEAFEDEDLRDIGELYDLDRDAILKVVKENNHDGVLLEYNGEMSAVVFQPNQIKSSIGNSGEFDPDNPSFTDNKESPKNSLGVPIHSTQKGIENFHNFFKQSQIVSDDGLPLVVFHGTQSDFHSFNPDERETRPSGGDPTTFLGSHFAKEISVANKFAKGLYMENKYRESEGACVIPVYLSIQKVFKTTEEQMLQEMMKGLYDTSSVESAITERAWRNNYEEDEAFQKYEEDEAFRIEVNEYALSAELRYNEPCDDLARQMSDYYKFFLESQGYDGIEYLNEKEGGTSYVAFSANQIKSAIGNSGSFDPNSSSFSDHSSRNDLEYRVMKNLLGMDDSEIPQPKQNKNPTFEQSFNL